MLFVTFHGTIGNIYGFDETKPGSKPIENLLEIPSSQLSELRGMLFANGFLYVVNGSKTVSNILCCTPDPNHKYHYMQKSVFISNALPAVNHPFDIAFRDGPNQTQIWYVSDQDSNVVATFTSPSPYDSASAGRCEYLSALLTALQNAKSPLAGPGFLEASFIPTSLVGAEIPEQTTVAPSWGGLTPIFNPPNSTGSVSEKKHEKQKVQNSVRGVALSEGVLYVADEGGSAVRMYDAATGVPLGSTALDRPVHLVVHSGNLYVTSGDSIFCGSCVTLPATIPAVPASDQFSGVSALPPYPAPPSGYTNSVTLTMKDLKLGLPRGSGPSGFAFDTFGNLYIGLRKSQQICAFAPNTNPKKGDNPFTPSSKNPIFTLKDGPEFLLWMENQSTLKT
jgi:hypothetical protein